MSCERTPDIKSFPEFFDLHKLKPENPISPIPVLVVPGFGSSVQSYRLLMEQLYFHDFITICPDYKYGMSGEPKKWLFFPDVNKVKQQAIFAAIEAEGYPNHQEIKQVNVIAHSKGAYDAVLAAVKHPHNFRNIIMVAPIGLRLKMNVFKDIKTLREGYHKDKEDKAHLIAERKDVAKLVLINNMYENDYKEDKMRYYSEGFAVVTDSMQKLLPALREKGIKTIIVSQIDDSIYPPDSYSAAIKSGVNGFIEVPGIHGEIKFTPHVGQIVSNLLKGMENI